MSDEHGFTVGEYNTYSPEEAGLNNDDDDELPDTTYEVIAFDDKSFTYRIKDSKTDLLITTENDCIPVPCGTLALVYPIGTRV